MSTLEIKGQNAFIFCAHHALNILSTARFQIVFF